MSLIQRVQRILFQPVQTWPVIAGEPATTASIYTRYVMILAAIPALASFIGLSVFGIGGFGVSVRAASASERSTAARVAFFVSSTVGFMPWLRAMAAMSFASNSQAASSPLQPP